MPTQPSPFSISPARNNKISLPLPLPLSLSHTHTPSQEEQGKTCRSPVKGTSFLFLFSGLKNLSLPCAHCQQRNPEDKGQAGLGGDQAGGRPASQAHEGGVGAWLLRHCKREAPSGRKRPNRHTMLADPAGASVKGDGSASGRMGRGRGGSRRFRERVGEGGRLPGAGTSPLWLQAEKGAGAKFNRGLSC